MILSMPISFSVLNITFCKIKHVGEAKWSTAVIPTLRTLKQEDQEFEASLDNLTGSS